MWERPTHARILARNDDAGRIIGKAGSSIAAMEAGSGTHIKLSGRASSSPAPTVASSSSPAPSAPSWTPPSSSWRGSSTRAIRRSTPTPRWCSWCPTPAAARSSMP